MKRIFYLLLLLLVVGCSNRINVYMDPELSGGSVDTWKQNVRFVELDDLLHYPDCFIYYRPDMYGVIKQDGHTLLGKTCPKDSDGNQVLYIFVNTPRIVAHEFGHFLEHEHSEDTNSVMYVWPYGGINRLLETFIEFQ